MGGRRRCRLHHRRDIRLGRRGPHGARDDQGHGSPGGRDVGGTHVRQDARRLDRRRRMQAGSKTQAPTSSASIALAARERCCRSSKRSGRAWMSTSRLFRSRTARPRRADVPESDRPPLARPSGDRPFPSALDPFTCNRFELEDFARRADALGVRYLGVCCGAGPHHIRAVAEGLERTPSASRYSPDMSKHAFYGTDERVRDEYKEYALAPLGTRRASDPRSRVRRDMRSA